MAHTSQMEGDHCVSIRDLSFSYDWPETSENRVLYSLNFELPRGSRTALVNMHAQPDILVVVSCADCDCDRSVRMVLASPLC
jgi:hypothetical protein